MTSGREILRTAKPSKLESERNIVKFWLNRKFYCYGAQYEKGGGMFGNNSMQSILKTAFFIPALTLCCLAPIASAQLIQTQLQDETFTERKQTINEILRDTLRISRIPEIYADLRYALREIYLPHIKQTIESGDFDEFDPNVNRRLAAVVPVLEYSLRAADEIDPVLEENRDAIIDDIASFLAKYQTEDEVGLAAEILRSPAAQKAFNTVYAFSRLITGYNQEDLLTSQKMSEWMKDLAFDFETNPFSENNDPPPPPERVAKAEAIVSDFMRVARIDDMVAVVRRFTNNVVLQIETLSEEERQKISAGVQQFEFFYNLGKSMAVAVAPSAIAAALDDEQLEKFHLLILSPVMAKSFGLLYDVVREATSFTKQDLTQLRQLTEEAQRLQAARGPDVKRLMDAEWEELTAKWKEILENSISLETRAGLEQAIAQLKGIVEDRRRRREHIGPTQEPKGDLRQL